MALIIIVYYVKRSVTYYVYVAKEDKKRANTSLSLLMADDAAAIVPVEKIHPTKMLFAIIIATYNVQHRVWLLFLSVTQSKNKKKKER